MDAYARRLAEESKQDASTLQESLVLTHAPLLALVLDELPLDSLLSTALVSRQFNAVATHLLNRSPRLDSPLAAERFSRLLLRSPDLGHQLRGFEVTKSSIPLLPALASLAPNLTSLTFASSTHLSATVLADLLPTFVHLQSLTIVGQDARSRRRRMIEVEPEGELGKALRAIADKTRLMQEERNDDEWAPFRLKGLRILSTPLKLSSLDYFLEVCGGEVEDLALEGCSLGPTATLLVEQWCPRLRTLRLDTLIPTSAPPSTPRPNLPPLEFSHSLPITLSHSLTSLHFASLPFLDPSAFALFAEVAHASLDLLSFSHCDISAAHLSHFTRVRRLRIVACPNVKSIPVFPDARGREDIGAGCRELRQVSLLGCTGLSLGNLWELAMLGREDLGEDEQAERRRLGLGGRGLKKLMVDAASSQDHHFSISGLSFTLPSGLGSPPSASDLPSLLPAALAPPTTLSPYLSLNILSPSLPSHALLATLLAAQDLEQLSLFGSIGRSRLEPLDADEEELTLRQRVLGAATGLLWAGVGAIPLVGRWLVAGSAAAGWSGAPPVPSPSTYRSTKSDQRETGAGWRVTSDDDGAAQRKSSARLSAEELERLRTEGSGRLISVHV